MFSTISGPTINASSASCIHGGSAASPWSILCYEHLMSPMNVSKAPTNQRPDGIARDDNSEDLNIGIYTCESLRFQI